ncbi:MAG: hypothetical protein Q7T86_03110 [Hyphomicrobiaceae bacterium]|nr:hypothetical protein [Hyphomicrobiaceae bacterium]
MGAFDDLIPKFRAPAAAPAQRAPGSGTFDDLIPKQPGQGEGVPSFRNSADTTNGLRHQAMPSDAVNAGLKAALGETLGNAAGYIPGIAVGNAWADAAAREKMSPPTRSAPTQMLEGFENVMRGAGQGTNPNAQPEQNVLGEAFQDAGGAWMYGNGDLINPDHHVVLKDPNTGKLMAYSRSKQSDEMGITGAARVMTQGMLTGPLTGAGRATTLVNEAAGSLPAERAAKATEDLAAFDRSGVPVYAPAFSDGPGRGLAKSLADTPFVGKPLANAADASAKAASERVDDIAGRFGSKPNEQQAGVTVRGGIERFKDARPADVVEDGIKQLDDNRLSQIILAPTAETSFKTKQGALYERAWRLIPEDMQKGASVKGETRVMGNPTHAREVVEDIVSRNNRMVNKSQGEAPPIAGGQLGRMLDAIRSKNWTANLQTMRNMRSEMRRLASGMGDTEKNVLKESDLQRIQSAITQDMVAQLQRNAEAWKTTAREAFGKADTVAEVAAWKKAEGFERAIKEFSQADKYTRLSIERMERIEKLFNADTGEALARNITNAALGGGRGNIEMLQTLAKTLRPDEMGEVRSMIFSKLGKPVASARGSAEEMAFSPNTFTTSWNKMSPEAKALLFDGEHKQAIDDIVAVSNRLSNVDAMGNVSRSGTHAINVGGVFALLGSVATGSVAPVAGAAAGSWGLAYLLSRPAYAKWTAQYLKLKSQTAAAPKAVDAALAVQVNRLAQMAQHDPQLQPILQQLRNSSAEDGVGQGPEQQGQQEQGRTAPGKGDGNQSSNSGAAPNHGGNIRGLLQPGNINLHNRPKVKNADGSISTVRSMSANIDGREVLLPTVSDDGRVMSDDEAIRQYERTGRHLGMFDSPAAATAYAQRLHGDQEREYTGGGASGGMMINPLAIAGRIKQAWDDTKQPIKEETRGLVAPFAQYEDGSYHLAVPEMAGLPGFWRAQEKLASEGFPDPRDPEAVMRLADDTAAAAGGAMTGGVAAGVMGAVPEGAVAANGIGARIKGLFGGRSEQQLGFMPVAAAKTDDMLRSEAEAAARQEAVFNSRRQAQNLDGIPLKPNGHSVAPDRNAQPKAAVKIGGNIFTGDNHTLALEKAQNMLGVSDDQFHQLLDNATDGFVFGDRFADRAQAAQRLGRASATLVSEFRDDVAKVADSARQTPLGEPIHPGTLYSNSPTGASVPLLNGIMKRFGRGSQGADEALASVASEIESLSGRYRQLFGKDFVAPKARPGTPADEVLKGEQQTLEELRSAVSSREGALAKAPDMPTTPKIRDISGERDELMQQAKDNPFVKAVPGKQGLPKKKEELEAIERFYKAGGSLPPGPWGRDPLDYQKAVREAFDDTRQQIARLNEEKKVAKSEGATAKLKGELKAANEKAVQLQSVITRLNKIILGKGD